jgi:hypothetical protein
MTGMALLFGKRAKRLATVLSNGSRTGSQRELIRLAKALTMSASGSEDEGADSKAWEIVHGGLHDVACRTDSERYTSNP